MNCNFRVSAVILAAGESERMGRPKALLEWRGLSFIEHVCSALRAAGAEDRVVVLGRASEEILAGWSPAGERTAVNPRPEDGQLSSLRIGLGAAAKNSDVFMVCLVDQPAIAQKTYKDIIDFWALHKDCIVIPRCRRSTAQSQLQSPVAGPRSPVPNHCFKRGHPVIIPAIYRRLCLEGPLEAGLHWVTHHPSVNVLDLNMEDENIIKDIDTPEDYENFFVGY